MTTLFVLAATLTVGCAARPMYQAVKFADPDPFTKPGCKLAIEEIRSDGLSVDGKPEAAWLSTRTPKQQQSYLQDKRTGQEKFTDYLQKQRAALLVAAGTKGDNIFVLRPTFTQWEPGSWGFVRGRPGVARMTFDVLDDKGDLLDELTFDGQLYGYSSGERMWAAYLSAGWAVNQYLRDRWRCATN